MPPDPAAFAERGWCRLGPDPALLAWVEHVRPVAAGLARTHRAQWLRAAGTWFAGVNILPNDPSGAVTSGPPLPPGLTARIARLTGFPAWEWDQGQISICHPGYPGRDPAESEAAFRYRRDRDAAHLDGLLAEGTAKRRFLREHHAFLLGIPLTETSPGAAPFVLWEGSHRLMRAAFAEVFAGRDPAEWQAIDVTECYHAARRRAFETCPRIALHARPGEAYLVHRLALHGMAPWAEGATAPPEGRMIAYFRPDPSPGEPPRWWLGP